MPAALSRDQLFTTLTDLKKSHEAPEWMTPESYSTLRNGYLIEEETPRDMYKRVAKAAARGDGADEHEFFVAMWKNWLCPASPVLSNMGTTRGFPISCNSVHIGDSVQDIFETLTEMAILSKHGAGLGVYVGDVRGRNAIINGNGVSEGIIPWLKCYDSGTIAVSQGQVRRGSTGVYSTIEHTDAEEFLRIRRPVGDVNRQCLNIHHAFTITDGFMERLSAGGERERKLWAELLKTRVEMSEPYMMFIDTVNRANPLAYTKHGLKVSTSNLCSEIMLYTDVDHTFVCCLSSLNIARWFEWKNTNLVRLSVRFLEGVLDEYIEKATGVRHMEPSVLSAVKGRALGLGALGWHGLLQANSIPFDSFDSMQLNAQIFGHMRKESYAESRALAEQRGEPEWCVGTGMRNTHTMAMAPTMSNSTIAGGDSPGIEPFNANIYNAKGYDGTWIRENPRLKALLASRGHDTPEVWRSMVENSGSVQHLSDEVLTPHERDVYKTAREINQHALVKQAAQRQKWIDQGQSLNLFFAQNASPQYIHDVHYAAWKEGVKSLYYLRSEGVLRGDLASRSKDECAACEG